MCLISFFEQGLWAQKSALRLSLQAHWIVYGRNLVCSLSEEEKEVFGDVAKTGVFKRVILNGVEYHSQQKNHFKEQLPHNLSKSRKKPLQLN